MAILNRKIENWRGTFGFEGTYRLPKIAPPFALNPLKPSSSPKYGFYILNALEISRVRLFKALLNTSVMIMGLQLISKQKLDVN